MLLRSLNFISRRPGATKGFNRKASRSDLYSKKKKKKISLTGLEVRVRGRKTNLGAFERFA